MMNDFPYEQYQDDYWADRKEIERLQGINAELLAACKAAKLYLDWGFGQLGPNAIPPGSPKELLQSTIAKAEGEE